MLWFLLACAANEEGPAAADLLAAVGDCAPIAGTRPFATDADAEGVDPPNGNGTVEICEVEGAVWWRADFDVDCDGGQDGPCLEDESWLPETAVTDGDDDYLDASVVPYVVMPLPWDPTAPRDEDFFYCDHGLSLGGVAAVIYKDHVEYAVIGDEGPVTWDPPDWDGECEGKPEGGGVIGEGSYALAEALGIDPDPNNGGVECGEECPVTWIIFTQTEVEDPGDGGEVEALGIERAWAMVGD